MMSLALWHCNITSEPFDVHGQELLLSYNIGVDRDVRQRKMVQSTAARVGLRLPTTDDGQV